MTALVTPFSGGRLDEDAFRALVRRQVDNGVQGLVPCGTTGEAPTLTSDEQAQLVEWTLEEARGQVPVLAGIGSNSTATAVLNARRMAALGVDGVLATAPYYNKPPQAGLLEHFKAIAEAVDVEISLVRRPGPVGHQHRALDSRRAREDRERHRPQGRDGRYGNATEVRRGCVRFALLSGDDFTTLPFLAQGGQGVISVASNVVPREMRELVDAARSGDLETASRLSERLFPLFRDLFVESNPIPATAALAEIGLCQDDLRLPLVQMSSSARPSLLGTLTAMGVLD